MEIGGKSKSPKVKKTSNNKDSIKDGFKKMFSAEGGALDIIEIAMIRTAIGLLLLLIVYIIFSNTISKNINKKQDEFMDYIKETGTKISEIEKNKKLVNDRTSQYKSLIQKIDDANKQLTASYAKKNAIPNFLTELMFNIPKDVQLVSITNTTGKAIKIEARSREYEQLGYFIAKIKNEAVLTEVKSTSGTKQDEFVNVTIEGNLPY